MMAVMVALCTAYAVEAARPPKVAPMHSWRELNAPHKIWPNEAAIYYSFDISGARAHLVVIDMRAKAWKIVPGLAQPTTAPTSQIAQKCDASAAVNGGYFNLKEGGASTSYVTINKVVAADPTQNKLLTENPKLKAFVPQIFNRTEVRFLTDAFGRSSIQFAKHNDPVPKGTQIIDSLQAGPRLLPRIDATEEAFVRVEPDGTCTDAINSKRAAARTAFGITPDGYAMMLTVAGHGQDPESSGVSLEELAAMLKDLGCSEAMNMDGGASSTMFVRLSTEGMDSKAHTGGTVVCGKDPETRVKSALLLVPRY